MVTALAAALVGFAFEPVAHELIGHAVTAWIAGTRVVLVASTFISTQGQTPLWVTANGPLANFVFGFAAYGALRRWRRPGGGWIALWVFACANLFIGFGYLLDSGLTNFGDAAVVIRGQTPALAWRAGLVVVGAVGYLLALRLLTRELSRYERNRLASACALAGGLLYVVAALFNPLGWQDFLEAGVAMAAAVVIGMFLIQREDDENARTAAWPRSRFPLAYSQRWLVAGIAVSVAFLFLGHGIRF